MPFSSINTFFSPSCASDHFLRRLSSHLLWWWTREMEFFRKRSLQNVQFILWKETNESGQLWNQHKQFNMVKEYFSCRHFLFHSHHLNSTSRIYKFIFCAIEINFNGFFNRLFNAMNKSLAAKSLLRTKKKSISHDIDSKSWKHKSSFQRWIVFRLFFFFRSISVWTRVQFWRFSRRKRRPWETNFYRSKCTIEKWTNYLQWQENNFEQRFEIKNHIHPFHRDIVRILLDYIFHQL